MPNRNGFIHLFFTANQVIRDLGQLLRASAKSRASLAAENLFLRKQLALFQERQIRPYRAKDSARWTLAFLSRFFDWRHALVVVKPDTLIRWHRKGFRLLWKWKSKPVGRPKLPKDLQTPIRRMAADNPIWGEERIANELLLKLGIQVSPRTVQKYLCAGGGPRRSPDSGQRWLTFIRNHAQAIVACDFFVVITAHFRILYVFVLMELKTRRIIHCNVTAHPTAEWTLQQFREAIPSDHPFRFLIHDRDGIYSKGLDDAVKQMRLHILKTPVRSPQAKAYASYCTSCEPQMTFC